MQEQTEQTEQPNQTEKMQQAPETELEPHTTATAEQAGPMENEEPLIIEFANKEADFMVAMEIIDKQNKTGNRRSLHLMAVVLILYWFIPLAWQDPGQILSWVMILLAVGVGVLVWKGPEHDNRRYAKRYAEIAPAGTVTIDHKRILIHDARGDSPFEFESGVAIYVYQNVLAINAAKNRFGMIPVDQLDEQTRERLFRRLRQRMGDNFVETITEPQRYGLFGNKRR